MFTVDTLKIKWKTIIEHVNDPETECIEVLGRELEGHYGSECREELKYLHYAGVWKLSPHFHSKTKELMPDIFEIRKVEVVK